MFIIDIWVAVSKLMSSSDIIFVIYTLIKGISVSGIGI